MNKKYKDIEHYKDDMVNSFSIDDDITITEKIDGANASIEKGDNGLLAMSRTQDLDEKNNLQGFYNYVQTLPRDLLDAHPNYIIFGEWLIKHTVKYPEEKMKHFYVFDLWDKNKEQWCQHDELVNFCSEAGLTMVPIFYVGKFQSWEHINSFVGKTQMGGEYGEGVVVKNLSHYKLPYNSHNITHTKIVNGMFREKKKSHDKGPIDPLVLAEKERVQRLTETIVTYPRIIKMIHKLEDEGVLRKDWDNSDMKTLAQNLPKRIHEDCVKEEPATVEIIGDGFGKACGSLTMQIAKDIMEKRKTMSYDEILKLDIERK